MWGVLKLGLWLQVGGRMDLTTHLTLDRDLWRTNNTDIYHALIVRPMQWSLIIIRTGMYVTT